MTVMTVNKLVHAIKAQDPENATNENMLKALFDAKKLTFWMHGNRIVCDLGILIEGINDLLGLNEKQTMPRLRSIHDAFVELRHSHPDLGISEERMRFLVTKGKLPHIKAGNRTYVALESFSAPYDQCLICDDTFFKSNNELKQSIIEEQFALAMARRNKKK